MMMGELNPSENTVRIITYVRNMFNLFSDIFVTECPKSSGLVHKKPNFSSGLFYFELEPH